MATMQTARPLMRTGRWMRRDDEGRLRGAHAPRQLGSANVLRLQALGPARDFELHLLAFLQGLEAFHLDR